MLFVAHADGDDRICVISARKATRREANAYKLRPEYDLTSLKGGVRGKYYKKATSGSNVVLLEPEVAEAFPSDKAVNEALKAVLVASAQVKHSRKRRRV